MPAGVGHLWKLASMNTVVDHKWIHEATLKAISIGS